GEEFRAALVAGERGRVVQQGHAVNGADRLLHLGERLLDELVEDRWRTGRVGAHHRLPGGLAPGRDDLAESTRELGGHVDGRDISKDAEHTEHGLRVPNTSLEG